MTKRMGFFFAVFALGTYQPGTASTARPLTLGERIEAQTAIEQVYWSHRIWPNENKSSKPTLSAVLPDVAIRAKVESYLDASDAVDRIWHRPITASALQAELDRITLSTRDPGMLRELFAALGNDPALIAETLARQTLAERLVRNWYEQDGSVRRDGTPFDVWWESEGRALTSTIETPEGSYSLREPADSPCTVDTWAPTAFELEQGSGQTAVWTGTEMIVWGGLSKFGAVRYNSGGRYNPATDSWLPTSRGANAPSPRSGHTSVWTGTEMIVWGGSGALDTGGRYNPATDAWMPTSPSGLEARSGHSAVWTGSEMIVWGGGGVNLLQSGGRYNPATDTWVPTSSSGLEARSGHSAVWTGSKMVVWGGHGGAGYLATGGQYDPNFDSWVPTSTGSNSPIPRSGYTTVWTGNEMIVWGGLNPNANNVAVKTGARYDPSTDSWLPTSTGSNVPAARAGHTALWTGTEMLVWGGSGGLNSGARYNPVNNSWVKITTKPTTPTGRGGHKAVWTGSEMIVWGGSDGSGNFLKTGGRYAPASGSWVPIAASTSGAPFEREGQSAVWTGTEMIVWGGRNSYEDSGSPNTVIYPTNTGGRYAPVTNSWQPTSVSGSAVPSDRSFHSAVWTGTEMIVWGGSGGSTGGRYDPSSNSWRAMSTSGGPASYDQAAVWTGTEMIVWVGTGGGRYDPSTNSWTATSLTLAPSPRSEATVVWTGTKMIVWGGRYGGARLNSGGRYDPSTNTWQATSLGTGVPEARYLHTAVWTGNKMIVWGGHDGSALNTGGRYDPASDTWEPTSVVQDTPSPRSGHSALWTGTEMVVWGGNLTDSGSRYNPSNDVWLATSTINGASLRTGHTAVWTGSKMIVWGGANGYAEAGINTINTGALYCADSCAVPAGSPTLTAAISGSDTVLSWPSSSGATGYDVVMGSLAMLRTSAGDFASSTTSCLANDTASQTARDSSPPLAGGTWYLVRPVNSCSGPGSYDDGAMSQSGVRDAEIGASGVACP